VRPNELSARALTIVRCAVAQHKFGKSIWNSSSSVLLVLASSIWGLLITGHIPAAQAEPTIENITPQKIEALKDGLIVRLSRCETNGRPEPDSVIVIDKNNEASIGALQFQTKTVVHYTRLIQGRSIDTKEAFEIALDRERASSLAKKIIFERDGISNWHICSQKLGLRPEVKAIQKMMRF
jgi:hypothetical protein